MASNRAAGRASGAGTAWWTIATLFLIATNVPASLMQTLRNTGLSAHNNLTDRTTICQSLDIRNSMDSFRALENCTVVEGFVQILLFDNVNESDFKDLSFPKLVEITDFLLLYRVNGLRSVGQLFPNLAVIRGQSKIFEYALVIYEMSSLQEIGLRSLRLINSGYVRIDKNPSLCYVNTINWNLIAAEESGGHFLKNIKPEDECPLCPGIDDPNNRSCPYEKHNQRYLCWDREHCQIDCPKRCNNSCDSKGMCCHPKCIGCSDGNPEDCIICRNVVVDQRCMNKCPTGYYKFLDRRCITREECINMRRPIKLHMKIPQEFPYKIMNDSCVLECPADHMDDYVNHTCVECMGRCKKECQGTVIDSVNSAQQLRGCTHINGSMEIQIRGGKNVVNVLEDNLSMIEEIDGYLKIVRSFPLVSLSFFKKLKIIRGNILENQKYVFVVLDNQNLQDIWNWENRTLRILKGKLFFHFNPRLCLDKIRTLNEMAKLGPYNDLEVAPNSNGDKIACNVKKLHFNYTVYSNSIVLTWEPFEIKDHRKLLGYVVYHVEAPYRNVSLYDGRDACGNDGWRVEDVPIGDNRDERATAFLNKLKPYTQYAVYVKTYTIASEESGALSDITYIKTKPGKPSVPYDVIASPKTNGSITLTWKPPINRNGNITRYIISGQKATYSRKDLLSARNFCSEKQKPIIPKVEPRPVINNTDCVCKDTVDVPSTAKKLKNDTIVDNQIHFEDDLYNFVYVKQHIHSMSKRQAPEIFPVSNSSNKFNQEEREIHNQTDKYGKYVQFHFIVTGRTELTLANLSHFTKYSIDIRACREREENDRESSCSEPANIIERTEKADGVDVITQLSLNVTGDNLIVVWEEPIRPNGQIASYHISYKKADIENSQVQERCIQVTADNFIPRYVLTKLGHGNWSLSMWASSWAGDGPATKDYYFYIEEQKSVSIWLIISLVMLASFAIILAVCYWCRKKLYPTEEMKLIPSVNPDYVPTAYVPDEWEVPRDKIKLLNELGQGSFGMVYEGVAKDVKGKALTRCAIKTVNEHATNRERIEFLNEASVMKAFDTAHVVRLLGVVSQGQPTLVIMELMANGDLKSYLRSHRPDVDGYETSSRQPPTLKRIMQMALEIADGMAYLSAKKFVHRDLAARNCMVADDLTVKIGDFGMTRDIYETDYYRKGTKGLLPVRWMAPESLKDGVFTSTSDVWSYGVVLWEMATLASQPYQGLSNDQVLRYVIDGGIMERPENCPDKLYDLMMRCWRHKPTDRPSFLELSALCLEDASPTFSQVSFYHSAAGMEARHTRTIHNSALGLQDDPSTPLRINDENYSIDSDNESVHTFEEGNLDFANYPSMTHVASTANGYVNNRASNGTTA